MGVDYSAAVCYGFVVDEEKLDLPEDTFLSEWIEDKGISWHQAGDFYGGGDYVVVSVDGTYRGIDFRYDTVKPIEPLPQDKVNTDSILELEVKCEKAGIPWQEPEWLMTTLIS